MISYIPLKHTLASKGLSGKKLAELLGVSQNAVSQYFIGKGNPSLEILDKICEVLDCDISDVVRYDHEDSVDNKLAQYEDELRMRFVSAPSEYDDFIRLMLEAYRKGLEE